MESNNLLKLEDAEEIAGDVLKELGSHIYLAEVCGSIRRQKELVHDIDIVMIPNDESLYAFGDEALEATIIRIGSSTIKLGNAIKSFFYKGIQVELYIATKENFECLRLIRTGSTEHNIRLTSLARGKDLKLYASGKGLCRIKGGIYNNEPEEIMEVVEHTEDGILMNLLGRVPGPEERNQ